MEVDKDSLGPKLRKDAKKAKDAIANILQKGSEQFPKEQESGGHVSVDVEGLGRVILEIPLFERTKSPETVPLSSFAPPLLPSQLT